MKTVLVIPDGMGDRPVKNLGGRTPLEAAKTPNMDFFSTQGLSGLSYNIPKGYTPGTDIGSMSVFGYDPRKYFTGRGPLEAAEHGIELRPNEIAFRCNLVTLEGEFMKDFSADHISLAEARILLESLDARVKKEFGDKVRFYPGDGTGYRNLMICSSDAKDLDGVRCTPPHDIMGKKFKTYLPKGKNNRLLTELMDFSREIFTRHSVNQKRRERGLGEASMIWLWGQGMPPKFPSYYKRFGFRGGVISAVDLVKGIAIHAGLDVIPVPGVTGYFDTNYVGKAEYAVNALRSRDFVAIHIESTDEAGHMGDARLKIKAIEDVDRLVLGPLRKGLEDLGDYRLLLTPDHFTCVETKTHSSDPVPFLAYSTRRSQARRTAPGTGKFCEKSAKTSGIVVRRGYELMEKFIHEKF